MVHGLPNQGIIDSGPVSGLMISISASNSTRVPPTILILSACLRHLHRCVTCNAQWVKVEEPNASWTKSASLASISLLSHVPDTHLEVLSDEIKSLARLPGTLFLRQQWRPEGLID